MTYQLYKTFNSFLLFLLFSYACLAQQVTTLAGSTLGDANGTGAEAQFRYPSGTAVDENGNIYVADSYGNRIRKITPEGIVTTLAGSGIAGYADGTGIEATFKLPKSLTCDKEGNIYVADCINHKIRKVTPEGVVTTVAGTDPLGGYVNGTAPSAKFTLVTDLTFDSYGNLFVADFGNNVIRKISTDGIVSTFAGTGVAGYADGAAAVAQFDSPCGITCDADNNLYIADFANNKIRKITPSGEVSTVAGSTKGYADGSGTAVQFGNPTGVACDNLGNIYVADNVNNRIRKINALGEVTTYAGSNKLQMSKDGYGTAADFYNPTGICFDPHGYLYVADENNNRIRRITAQTAGMPTGIYTSESAVFLSVYPNPSSTEVSIESSSLITSIDVTDVTGSIVKTVTPEGNASIDVSGLSTGIYFLQVHFSDGYKAVKFIKN